MLRNTVVVRAGASYSSGLDATADAVVEYGPQAVINTTPVNGLEFRVYDPTNTTFLGSIIARSTAQWTEELNGKGMGRLTASINSEAFHGDPAMFADDNVIRAHFRGADRFAWRVKAGTDTIVGPGEASDETIGLDGPGVMDLLEEAIVFPEYSLATDPVKEAQDRFFGYMSKVEPTQMEWSDSVYNLVTKPQVTSSSDWSAVIGGSTGTPSVGAGAGLYGYNTFKWTYTSSGSDEVRLQYDTARAVAVDSHDKVSLAVWVITSADIPMSLVADTDAGDIFGPMRTVYAGEPTELILEDVLVPVGGTGVVPAVHIYEEGHVSGETVEIFWPILAKAPTVSQYFDGSFDDTNNYVQSWVGSANNSSSVGAYQGRVLDNLQPSWYDNVRSFNGSSTQQDTWSSNIVAVRKDKIKTGTAKAAPDDWADPTAYAIWPSDPRKPSNPGTVYWRHEFSMPKDAAVFVQAAADNRMRVWLDGVEIISEGFNGDGTDITGSWDGILKKGMHLIAAETTNFKYSQPGKNYGWFLASVMYKVNNEPVGVISHSNKTWKAYFQGDTNVPSTTTTTTTGTTTSTTKKVPLKYTVRRGDTLIGIGKKFGVSWRSIYNANKAKIDARAAASGLPNNGPGWWIFPGQVFVIPGKYTTTSTKGDKKTVTKTSWTAGDPLTTQAPGWYPYQILAQLVTEAQRRNVTNFNDVELGFQFGFDSAGIEWETGYEPIVDRSFRIGDTVYNAVQELIEGGMDVRMAPDYTLNAYREMGRYKGINCDPQYQFHLLDKGGTTLTYVIEKRTNLRNFMLIDTDKGWREYSNLESDATNRSEASASVGGVGVEKIIQAIGDQMEELGKKTKTVTTLFVVEEGRVPYIDFDLGDVVVAKDVLGRPFDVRIVSMSVREEETSIICEIQASGEGL